MRGYVIVRNPKPRILPQFVRAWLGEEYMYVNIFPAWTSDIRQARVFLTPDFAAPYIRRMGQETRPGFEGTMIRRC